MTQLTVRKAAMPPDKLALALCNSPGNGRGRMPVYKVRCLESEMHPWCPGHASGRALCQSPGMSRGTRRSPLPSGSLKPKGLHKVMRIVHHDKCSPQRMLKEETLILSS